MKYVKQVIDSVVWFVGGLLGVESIISRPYHDLTGRDATIEDMRGH
jgi:hypothetical protein